MPQFLISEHNDGKRYKQSFIHENAQGDYNRGTHKDILEVLLI